MKTALIFGITGQIGSYLAELLLVKGYFVVGVIRRASTINTSRIDHLYDDSQDSKLKLVYGDILDSESIISTLVKYQPDEIYNLAAQSHVKVSFELPTFTADTDGLGPLRLFDAVYRHCPGARVYQASSSELFGNSPPAQSETTPFNPQSPYACAKALAFYAAKNYREAYGLHISNGICFNSESQRRGETFVTRKITRAVGRIKVGLQKKLYLGNLLAKRDWTHALEAAEAMWRMLQVETPTDYVIGSGVSWSVLQFARMAFAHANLEFDEFVVIDPKYYRPTEVNHLQANPTKIFQELGWRATKSLPEIVVEMAESDLKLARKEAFLANTVIE